jgi:hypothetical protein
MIVSRQRKSFNPMQIRSSYVKMVVFSPGPEMLIEIRVPDKYSNENAF